MHVEDNNMKVLVHSKFHINEPNMSTSDAELNWKNSVVMNCNELKQAEGMGWRFTFKFHKTSNFYRTPN